MLFHNRSQLTSYFVFLRCLFKMCFPNSTRNFVIPHSSFGRQNSRGPAVSLEDCGPVCLSSTVQKETSTTLVFSCTLVKAKPRWLLLGENLPSMNIFPTWSLSEFFLYRGTCMNSFHSLWCLSVSPPRSFDTSLLKAVYTRILQIMKTI